MSVDPQLALPIILFAVALVWAAGQDVWARRIPNYVTGAIALLAPLGWLTGGMPGAWWEVPTLAFAVLAVGTVLFARGWVGGGDVKLATASMLWAGSAYGLSFLLISALAGGALALVYIVRPYVALTVPGLQTGGEADSVPYGVAFAAGGLWVAHRLLAG
ncbi:A24 family peptidase [Ferruginivarius sediminum]|uniref:Peptidase n=1 Tax=Ferruginivarius sediminum TaxID=2661937 RepID=A0A369TBN8_9PROT|nr:prepilin peptidase [Ferruginivarius sediminum]RDD62688.1 peptidase [Ferruginivarius sediminum]